MFTQITIKTPQQQDHHCYCGYTKKRQQMKQRRNLANFCVLAGFALVCLLLAQPHFPMAMAEPTVTRPSAKQASVCLVLKDLGAEDSMIMTSIAWQNKTTSNILIKNKEDAEVQALRVIDLKDLIMTGGPEGHNIRVLAIPDYVLRGGEFGGLDVALGWPCEEKPIKETFRFMVIPCWFDKIDWETSTKEKAMKLRGGMDGGGRLVTLFVQYHPKPMIDCVAPPEDMFFEDEDQTHDEAECEERQIEDSEYTGPTTRIQLYLPTSDALYSQESTVELSSTDSHTIDLNRLIWHPENLKPNNVNPAATFDYDVTAEETGLDRVMDAVDSTEPKLINGEEYCRLWLHLNWSAPRVGRHRQGTKEHVISPKWTVQRQHHS